MKLKNSGKAAIIVAALAGTTVAVASESKVDFYGNVVTGLHIKSMEKVDTTDADVASAVTRLSALDSDASVATKDMSYNTIGAGYAATKFGVNWMASDKVTGKLEFGTGVGEGAADGGVAVRKYYLDVDLGAGHVVMGRQGRLFQAVATAADSFSIADTGYAGLTSGPSRSVGVVYSTADLLGPATIKLGLFNNTAQEQGVKSAEKAPESTAEFQAGVAAGPADVKLGLISEKRTVATDTGYEAVGATGYALSVGANVSVVSATLAYTGGDALFGNVTSGNMITKAAKDSMSAVTLTVGASMADASVGIYYGMETLTHKKDNGAVDKDQMAKDIEDAGSTAGLSLGYNWSGVTWMAEFVNTQRTFDSQTVKNETAFALGAATSFKS